MVASLVLCPSIQDLLPSCIQGTIITRLEIRLGKQGLVNALACQSKMLDF